MATAMFGAVSGDELDRHLRAISREVRLSGTPEEARAFDHIEAHLAGLGYTVSRFANESLVGYPGDASLEILGNDAIAIHANGYALSPPTPEAGITGVLLDVGDRLDAETADLDACGALLLSDGLATPEKALAVQRAGAIGHIHINDEQIHEMCISPVWGMPIPETAALLPSVPAVGISAADGKRLRDVLGRGAVQVRLRTQPYRAWDPIPTLVADLPGDAEDQFVLFSGHVDSWHLGVMDNGTANATQLEVARLLAARRRELRRGVRLAFWSGHSHGRYAGSAWYADAFWHDLHERCVCHVNVDSVGAIGATVLEEAPAMAETYGFARTVLAETTGADLTYTRISRSSDQSFWGHGIPSLFGVLSQQPRDDSPTGAALATLLGTGGRAGGLGWWWHTPEDTLDKIDPANLRRDAGVYAEAMWRLCTMSRLPIDPAAAADEMAAALGHHQSVAGETLDLSSTQTLATDLADALRAAPEPDDEGANARSMALCRLLIPVNYTRNGPFEQDLATSTSPLPGLSDAARLSILDPRGDDARFLLNRLLRERNRVEHALRAATRLL